MRKDRERKIEEGEKERRSLLESTGEQQRIMQERLHLYIYYNLFVLFFFPSQLQPPDSRPRIRTQHLFTKKKKKKKTTRRVQSTSVARRTGAPQTEGAAGA